MCVCILVIERDAYFNKSSASHCSLALNAKYAEAPASQGRSSLSVIAAQTRGLGQGDLGLNQINDRLVILSCRSKP
jgi:hypothetical protein